MRYRILFRDNVANAPEKAITIEAKYLRIQLTILIKSGYKVIRAYLLDD